ncbi:hypothetical protein EPUS_07515 [Endocarpon pusillum Z07020]|uniref:Uncharacterized protein n=1 Tax=Endocarpon pusillum (strain Z07020 / HMAS-L-300199) TaxID=1263415 RepID=U1GNS1_ENDPU|nr:uncharacterized protein EPUS_07515 [Endocarpon pusillum Z07020]ERF73581.1 hypothetical protein EPUS_07515 [Endocarpon pusillum Z07020]
MDMHQTPWAPIAGPGNYQQQYRPAVRYDAAPQYDDGTAKPRTSYQIYQENEGCQNFDRADAGVQDIVPSEKRYTLTSIGLGKRFTRNALSWTCLLLTTVLFLITILYACRPKFAASLQTFRSSSSRTIFILRLLSQLTEFLLAVSLSSAFEKIQWYIVWPGGRGAPFATVSALVPGTGVWGLFQIAFSKLGTHFSARCWSIVRLLSLAVIFALGVLIMGDVRTDVGFQIVAPSSEPRSYGFQNFNSSAASLLAFSADQVFGVSMDEFLVNPRFVVDITPVDRGNQSCSTGYDINKGQACTRNIFLPTSAGSALDETHPEADLVVVQDAIGYQLEFTSLDEAFQFDSAAHCHIYGTDFTAFQLCLRSAYDARIAARLNYCAIFDGRNGSCLSSTEWAEAPGWRTLMEATLRKADVAYSRRNNTIVAHFFKSDKNPAAVEAGDLLQAYNLLIDSKPPQVSSGSDTLNDIIESVFSGGDLDNISDTLASLVTVNKLSVSIPSAFHVLDLIYLSSSRRAFRGSEILQNLLAIPLWYCSQSSASNVVLSEADPTTSFQTFTDNTRQGPEVFLARSEYNLTVGRWTVMAYAVLGGVAIVFCFVALTLATFHPRAASLPDVTFFPLFNFWKWTAVKGDVDPRASDRWSREQRVFCTSGV